MNLTMEKNCGVYRNRNGLQEACTVLRSLRERFENVAIDDRNSVFNTDLTTALELDFNIFLSNGLWFPTLKFFYMSHEISRRIFRWVKKFKYSNAKPNGFFDIQNPTGFWIQIGTLFCGKVSAACQLPPPLISKWIYSLGPEIFELLCFRPLAPSVFGFFSFLIQIRKGFFFCRLRT